MTLVTALFSSRMLELELFRDVHLDVFRNGEISFAFVLLVFLDEL